MCNSMHMDIRGQFVVAFFFPFQQVGLWDADQVLRLGSKWFHPTEPSHKLHVHTVYDPKPTCRL